MVEGAAADPRVGVGRVRDGRPEAPTRSGSRPGAGGCCTSTAGTSAATACRVRRRCACSRAPSATGRSTARFACSASARGRSTRSPQTPTARWTLRLRRGDHGARARPDDRLRAGRQREHRRVRRLADDRRRGKASEAWLHVDGAFGLWAAASPRTTALVDGIELADSWACDGHKWLNVPYDSGYAFCAHPDVHATALAYTAAYLTGQEAGREYGGGDFVLESSRRARGFATWAAIRALGRSGVAQLVDRCCAHARDLAARLAAVDGIEIANEVVLNQVLIRVGDGDAHAADRTADPGRGNGLARRHDLARRAAAPRLGLQLVDDRGRHGRDRGRDRPRSCRAQLSRARTASKPRHATSGCRSCRSRSATSSNATAASSGARRTMAEGRSTSFRSTRRPPSRSSSTDHAGPARALARTGSFGGKSPANR